MRWFKSTAAVAGLLGVASALPAVASPLGRCSPSPHNLTVSRCRTATFDLNRVVMSTTMAQDPRGVLVSANTTTAKPLGQPTLPRFLNGTRTITQGVIHAPQYTAASQLVGLEPLNQTRIFTHEVMSGVPTTELVSETVWVTHHGEDLRTTTTVTTNRATTETRLVAFHVKEPKTPTPEELVTDTVWVTHYTDEPTPSSTNTTELSTHAGLFTRYVEETPHLRTETAETTHTHTGWVTEYIDELAPLATTTIELSTHTGWFTEYIYGPAPSATITTEFSTHTSWFTEYVDNKPPIITHTLTDVITEWIEASTETEEATPTQEEPTTVTHFDLPPVEAEATPTEKVNPKAWPIEGSIMSALDGLPEPYQWCLKQDFKKVYTSGRVGNLFFEEFYRSSLADFCAQNWHWDRQWMVHHKNKGLHQLLFKKLGCCVGENVYEDLALKRAAADWLRNVCPYNFGPVQYQEAISPDPKLFRQGTCKSREPYGYNVGDAWGVHYGPGKHDHGDHNPHYWS